MCHEMAEMRNRRSRSIEVLGCYFLQEYGAVKYDIRFGEQFLMSPAFTTLYCEMQRRMLV